MSNLLKTVSLIAREALVEVDNELVFGNAVFRGHEEDFKQRPNGYKIGDTLTIRRQADFHVRDGQIMDVQDIVEGSTTITLDKFKGVDFSLTNVEMNLSMTDLRERVIKPAARQIANQIDIDLAALAKKVPNWVGTPASPVDSFSDFAKATERLTEMGCPFDNLKAVLAPADFYGLKGSQTNLNSAMHIAEKAYRTGDIIDVDGVEIMRSQNVASLTCGSRENATVAETLVATTASYATHKDAAYYELDLASAGVSKTIAAGDTFSIANCYDVNPVTKARLAHLKQFTVVEAVTTESDETVTVKIWPIPYGDNTHGQQNCDMNGEDLDGNTVTWFGTAGTVYRQNLVFNKNAFALVIVPLVEPVAAVGVKTATHKGTSIRVWPGAEQNTNVEKWRMDVLYGVACINPNLACRLSGTS